MPTSKGTEASLSFVQCFLYLVAPSIHGSIFHRMRLNTFWTDLFLYTEERLWKEGDVYKKVTDSANILAFLFLITSS